MFEPLSPGTMLWSRYQISELKAQGGQGSIYLAEDLRLEGRLCAIKEVVPELEALKEQKEQMQAQFQQEASILARLDHPNLPKVSDFFHYNGRDYLVMDYIRGPDLREIIEKTKIEKKQIPETQVLEWATQIIDALSYLHRQIPPILHRDIKPSNIKLPPDGPIKLVDFGLVKVMAPDDNRTITVLQGKGSAQYTPLEQYGGDSGHTDVRSDIFSLGATLYHLLTLQPPLEAKERFLKPNNLIPLKRLNPTITTRTEQVVLQALAMHPNDRIEDAETLKEALLGHRNFPTKGLSRKPLISEEMAFSISQNRDLVTILIVLSVLAILLTLFSPSLPPLA